MKSLQKLVIICTLFMLTAEMIFPKGAWCITIKQEEELSREFMKMVLRQVKVIKDPYIDRYVNKIGQRIVSVLPPQPFEYKFHVIKDNDYNAFAIPAGQIFINSGLFAAMENENELAGIIAHETAHVACRHISQKIERSSKISLLTAAGLIAAIFMGTVGGSAKASEAISIGSMAAGQSLSLAYSREDERQADHQGLEYLAKAGYNSTGLLNILKKIRDKQWFGPDVIPTYLMTHPALEERITNIDIWLHSEASNQQQATSNKQPATSNQQPATSNQQPATSNQQSEFQMAHTRLVALYGDENKALKIFKQRVSNNPEDTAAIHGYGLILARTGKHKEAITNIRKALEKKAFDSQILKDLGRAYLLDGQYPEALKTLKGALSIEPNDLEGLFFLGRTQMELKDFQAAVSIFENLIENHPDYKHNVLYPLAEAYERQGKQDQARYYLGIYYKTRRDFKNAVFHLEHALRLIKDPEKKLEIEQMIKEIKKKSKMQEPPS